ncbi:MAG: glycerophosphoryl diester phosphodiesterase [Nocardioidaceae bacterium]|nr:glycerophosphoryl diester phosphodiesterase [Nocardioidaceae bacterium]
MRRRRTVSAGFVALCATVALFSGPSATSAAPSTTVAASSSRAPSGLLKGRTLVIAHRGDSSTAPENTLPAMRAAASAGADMVEFDVQRTSDGHLIVVHDTTFARTTDIAQVYPALQNDPVGSFTLAQVRRLDAGQWFAPRYAGTKIPTLNALLHAMAPTRTGLLLELKNPSLYPGYEAQIAHALDSSGFTSSQRVWVHSFDPTSLERFHDREPTVPVGLITETGTAPSSDQPWITSVNTTTAQVTDKRVDAAASADVRVLAWPAQSDQDTSAEAERLVDDGVSGIITDYPSMVRRVVGQHTPAVASAHVSA